MSEKKPRVGSIGIVIGSIALLLALFHHYAGPLSPQPKLERTIAETAVALRDATMAALNGKEIKKRSWTSKWDADKLIDVMAGLFGGLAVICGFSALIRKEPFRVTVGAAVLGGGAIAFQYVVMGLWH